MKLIPYGHQYIDSNDIREVTRVLKSEWLTQGPKIGEFEKVLCGYTGAKYAVALSSGTTALHIAALSAGIKNGNEVITSPITFVASANCIIYCGGKPVFADIQDNAVNIDPAEIEKNITKNTKAIIPVHFAGHPAGLEEIRRIAKKHNLKVIEDAAHALGAEYKGSKIGSCKYSDMAIFSFHPVKSITTGEGGALLTNDRKIYESALRLRHHGICRVNYKPKWFYDIPEIGFNYRITDFQCALGLSQMKKLDKMIRARKKIVDTYNKAFSNIAGITLPYEQPYTGHAYHLYVIRVSGGTRDKLYDYLRGKGILAQVNYIPIHMLTYYKKRFGYRQGDFPAAEQYFRECLSLPLYAGLSAKDQAMVIKEVRRFFKNG